MQSRKIAPLAGLALGLLLDPAYAEENTLELDTISVTTDAYESASSPVKGYRAT
jgi:iron complex outermembrane receptor protein